MSIHQTAIVDPGAQLGKDVSVGPFTVIAANVEIGDGTRIGSHCLIGHASVDPDDQRLVIESDSIIRSHTVVYLGSQFGPRLETGHHVTIREKTVAGINLRVGSASDLQGNTQVGDYVRIHSGVFVSKLARIDDFVWIFPHAVLTDDPTPPSDETMRRGCWIKQFAVISAQACLAPGVTVGTGAFVASSSLVTRDVPDGISVKGSPAHEFGPASQIRLRDGSGRPAYPWTSHFTRGYPDEVIRSWAAGSPGPPAD